MADVDSEGDLNVDTKENWNTATATVNENSSWGAEEVPRSGRGSGKRAQEGDS